METNDPPELLSNDEKLPTNERNSRSFWPLSARRGGTYALLGAVVCLVVVVLLTALLVFYSPFKSSSGERASNLPTGWSGISCPMFRENVNFTVQFFVMDYNDMAKEGPLIMLVDDLQGGKYTLISSSSESIYSIHGVATDENHQVERNDGTSIIEHVYEYDINIRNSDEQTFSIEIVRTFDDRPSSSFTLDAEDSQLLFIRTTTTTTDDGFSVYPASEYVNLTAAFNTTSQAWDACGFAYENEEVIEFTEAIAAEQVDAN